MQRILSTSLGLVAAAVASACAPARAGEVEVLHWWTSGGEAKAAAALKASMQAKGHTWKDFAVAGGGGDAAMTVLKSRVVSGNAPAAAQIKGPRSRSGPREGVLANLDAVAKAEKWDELLPKVVADVMKYKGNYVAVPVNVHRVNWLWANPAVLKKAGAKLPTTWDEFFVAAEALKKAGVIPVAHGGQNWQDFTTFEIRRAGRRRRRVLQEGAGAARPGPLTSPTMEKVLKTFKRIKDYTDKNATGRDWNLATAMVIKGEAGMQLMGDWAKGEFIAAGKVPGKDFVCAAAPGTAKAFTFNVDSFAMFKLKNDAKPKAQNDLAAAIMGTEFQEVFNLNKGSIPVRLGMKMDKFDDCAKLSAQGLRRRRQERRPGALDRPRHGGAAGRRRRDQGRGQPVLERRQDDRQGRDGQAGGGGEDEVSLGARRVRASRGCPGWWWRPASCWRCSSSTA